MTDVASAQAAPPPHRVGAEAADVAPFWLAGEQAFGTETLDLVHPFDGRVVSRVSLPTAEQVELAVERAAAVAKEAYVGADALDSVSRALAANAGEIAQTITAESGKPIRWARLEVGRAVARQRPLHAPLVGATAKAMRRWANDVVDGVPAVLAGEVPAGLANPEVLTTTRS